MASSTTSSSTFARRPAAICKRPNHPREPKRAPEQHVDHHIASALLKKGTRDAYKTWNQQDRAWVDMRLHESHDEGGFGVSNNTITRHAASYTTNARFVAFLGTFPAPLSRSGCQATTSRTPPAGMPPPFARSSACTGNSCRSTTAPSSRQWHSPRSRPTHSGGGAAANAGAHPQPHAGFQDNANGKLLLPQLDRLHLAIKSSSSQDQQAQQPPKSVIPTQRRVTEQLTKNWAPFKALRQHYAGTRFEEQRQLHLPQKHKATFCGR
jgi:hypothetical protein